MANAQFVPSSQILETCILTQSENILCYIYGYKRIWNPTPNYL